MGKFTSDELEILSNSNIVFWHGANFVEFSHDQMRGFFAARWLATHLGTTTLIIDALKADDVWKQPGAVQSELFAFFAEIIIAKWQESSSCE